MNKRMMTALSCTLLVSFLAAMPTSAANRLTNGSFEKWEKGMPSGWTWWRRDGVPPERDNPTPVGIKAADDEAYTGDRCIRMWKRSPAEPNRFGMLYQDVKGLPAGATLHFRARIKGKGVGGNMWCPWKHTANGPEGDFNWRQMKGTVHLGQDETELRFKIVITGRTEGLWVDDLQLIVAGEGFDATAKSAKAETGQKVISSKRNYVSNGSFEPRISNDYAMACSSFSGWSFTPADGRKTTFMRDAGESAHGVYSMRISKETDAPRADVKKVISGLPAGATTRYSVMVKGKGVKGASFVAGSEIVKLPDGDYDWRKFSGTVKLPAGRTYDAFRVTVDGAAEALWVDDFQVWLDGGSLAKDEEYLFIRRMQPWARPGVSTIKGTKQFPEPESGFEVIVRNPKTQTETFVLNWTLSDALGAPVKCDTAKIELAPLQQKRIEVLADLSTRRVASMLATVSDESGKALAGAHDFVTGAPESLKSVKHSRHFGFGVHPYSKSAEVAELYMDQLAAGGCGMWGYRQMERAYDHKNKSIDITKDKTVFEAARARGITIIPTLFAGPPWASTAPADASLSMKRMWLPQLDVWSDLVKQFVGAHQFKIVEVWNEPEGTAPLGYPKDVAYAKLLNATYDAVKSVGSDIIVVGGSGQTGGTSWAEGVLKAGGKMDAYSFHPYTHPSDSSRGPSIEKPIGERSPYPAMIESLNEVIAKYNDGKPLPLYVTEVGDREYKDGKQKLHGMNLYRTQYHIRNYLTLAGLGVESIHVFFYCGGFQMGQRGDFSLRPDWWATRTLHEVAGVREVGKFTPLTDDMFSVPMTRDADVAGATDAVAVWTVEDAAIVGTTKPIAEVRDLFGRTVQSLSTKTGNTYVIPAGSVIYMIGAGDLTAADIQPLMRLVPDTWRAAPGKAVKYTVTTSSAAKTYFKGAIAKTVSLAISPSVVRWAVGAIELPLGGQIATVPVMVPVKSKIKAGLEFNALCYPEVRIENNKPKFVDAKINIRAGDKKRNVHVRIPAYSMHTETIEILPANSSEPLDVTADIVIDDQELRVAKQLFYAKVPSAQINVDGKADDWKNIERIKLSQWIKTPYLKEKIEDPSGPKDLSAQMALAYDARNFYVLVEVDDDVHFEPYAAGQAWEGDSVQLAFDTNPTDEHNRAEMDFALSDSGEEIEVLRPLNSIDSAAVQYRIRRVGGKTIYELAFPLAALHMKSRGPGTRLGFSLLVNENDGAIREGWLRWSAGIGSTKDPGKYGQLIFVE